MSCTHLRPCGSSFSGSNVSKGHGTSVSVTEEVGGVTVRGGWVRRGPTRGTSHGCGVVAGDGSGGKENVRPLTPVNSKGERTTRIFEEKFVVT